MELVPGPQPARGPRLVIYVVGTYVVHAERVLLMYHETLQRWVPPGGRIDVLRGELPHEAAIRKTQEETGLTVSLLSVNNEYSVEDGVAHRLPQPLLTQLIDRIDHFYFDYVFLASSATSAVQLNYEQARAYHWFTAEELEQFPIPEHISVHARRALVLACTPTLFADAQ